MWWNTWGGTPNGTTERSEVRAGLRDAVHSCGTGARTGDRSNHCPDLPDEHLRAGRARGPQGIRLFEDGQPYAYGAADGAREPRVGSVRPRIFLRHGGGDYCDAPAPAGGSP